MGQLLYYLMGTQMQHLMQGSAPHPILGLFMEEGMGGCCTN